MSHMQVLYPVLKSYIFSFLSYEDKNSSYNMLECKKPKRPTITDKFFKGLAKNSQVAHKWLNLHYKENWYIRASQIVSLFDEDEDKYEKYTRFLLKSLKTRKLANNETCIYLKCTDYDKSNCTEDCEYDCKDCGVMCEGYCKLDLETIRVQPQNSKIRIVKSLGCNICRNSGGIIAEIE